MNIIFYLAIFLLFFEIYLVNSTSPPPHPDSCAAFNISLKTIGVFANLTTIDPDAFKNTPELVVNHGRTVENYTVTTEDGYILTLFRILKNSNTTICPNVTGAVLMMHGLLGASHDFLLNPPSMTLPYLLSDKCYDVFLGNNRGTNFSQNHVTLNKNDPKFWKFRLENVFLSNKDFDLLILFSWHEMGIYDVPSFINKTLEVSGQQKIFYIGMSQGTTQYLVAMSNTTKHDYNQYIRLAVLLAPVAFMEHAINPTLKYLAKVLPLLNPFFQLVNGDFGIPAPLDPAGHSLLYFTCSNYGVSRAVCAPILFTVAGFNPQEMNCTRIPIYVSYDPDDSSFRSLWHYIQLISSKKFQTFDNCNLLVPLLGQKICLQIPAPAPPVEYNLTAITAKIAMFYGSKDTLSNYMDVEKLIGILNNRPQSQKVVVFNKTLAYEHLDFYWGLSIVENIYNDLLNQLFPNY